MNKAYVDRLFICNKIGKIVHYVNTNINMLSQNDIQYILRKLVINKDIKPIKPMFMHKDIKLYIEYLDAIHYPFCNNYKIQKYMYCSYKNLYWFNMNQSLDMVKYRLSPIISVLDPIIKDQAQIFSEARRMMTGTINIGMDKRINNILPYLLTQEITLKYSFDKSIKNENWYHPIHSCMKKHFISDDGICRYPYLYKKYTHKYRM